MIDKYKSPSNYHISFSSILAVLSLIIAALSLIVAILSLTLHFYTWRMDVTPSISVTTTSSIVPDSFNLTRNGTQHYSYYTLEITADISNNSNQGCIIRFEPLIRRTLTDQTIIDLHVKNTLSLPVYDDNFTAPISLKGHESYSTTVFMRIYFNIETTRSILKEYGELDPTLKYVGYKPISGFDPHEIIDYLDEEGVTPHLLFSFAEQDDEDVKSIINNIADLDQLLLSYSTNTGPSGIEIIDYLE